MFKRPDSSFCLQNHNQSSFSEYQHDAEYRNSNSKYLNNSSNNNQTSNPILIEDYEFSFKDNNNYYDYLNYNNSSKNEVQITKQFDSCNSQNNTLSLRDNLIHLEKDEIIQILLEEIKSNKTSGNCQIDEKKVNRIVSNRPNLQEQTSGFSKNKVYNQSIGNDPKGRSPNQHSFKQKYQQLVKYFEQYINNTNQAQSHYVKTIDDLKKQNKTLTQQVKILNKRIQSLHKSSSSQPKQSLIQSTAQKVKNIQKTTLINKLQQTVQNYININNDLQNKLSTIQRNLKDELEKNNVLNQKIQQIQEQNQEILLQNHKLQGENNNFKSIIDELKLYIEERRKAKQRLDSSVQEDRQMSGNYEQKQLNFNKNKSQQSNKKHYSNTQQQQSSSNKYPSNTTKNKDFQFQEKPLSQDDLNIDTFRILQLSNKQLKIINFKLQQTIEKKSQKIRSLLEQIQKISQQKIGMKQEIMVLKCKIKKNEINSNYNNGCENVVDSKFTQNSSSTIQNSKLDKFDQAQKSFLESSSMPVAINGIKMVNSSIYSLKNSQSNSKIQEKSNCVENAYQQSEQKIKEMIENNIIANQMSFGERNGRRRQNEKEKAENKYDVSGEKEYVKKTDVGSFVKQEREQKSRQKKFSISQCKKYQKTEKIETNQNEKSSTVGRIKNVYERQRQNSNKVLKEHNNNILSTPQPMKLTQKSLKSPNQHAQSVLDLNNSSYTLHSHNDSLENAQFHIPKSLFNSNSMKKLSSQSQENPRMSKNSKLQQSDSINKNNQSSIYDKSAYLIKSPPATNASNMKKHQNPYDYIQISQSSLLSLSQMKKQNTRDREAKDKSSYCKY